MELYRTLSPEEEARFRLWADKHHKPRDPINEAWHPVVKDQCKVIDERGDC